MNFKNLEIAINAQKTNEDAVIILRNGDFYEAYGVSAYRLADCTDTGLVNYDNYGLKIPYAAFPFPSIDIVLPRLIKGGYKVIITDGE